MAKDKANRPKARLPRGFADRTPGEIRRVARMMETIRQVYERWGFEPVETPLIEFADALGKFLPDADRPNEGVFAFQDDDEQWLSLRYDLTAPLARMVAENFQNVPRPYKSYRAGWVFRNEKPGPGRFRQFMQFDADIVGAASPLADAEICMMAADTMEALGFARGEYVIRVNSRKILDAVLDKVLGIEGPSEKHLGVLRAIDKLDRLGRDGVYELLTDGRKDESGAFTDGVGLTDLQARAVQSLFGIEVRVSDNSESFEDDQQITLEMEDGSAQTGSISNSDILAQMFRVVTLTGADPDCLRDLFSISDHLQASGYGTSRVRIDPSVVRGLEYYTGAVFEAELRFEVQDEKGRPVRFGSVGGGGRYDGLVGRFISQDVPATGFSVGVSRLAAALAARETASADDRGPVIVTVMDRDAVPAYQALTAQLRRALGDVPVEMYIGDSGFKAQMKYADRRNAPCVIIQGADERAAGIVQIKDLAAGKEAAEAIEDRAEWVAARPAQVEVAYDGADVSAIAAKVREILS
ncbi:histidine--tRNA ligase [Acuticoccus yangtzensis]|uniref:histidine--tRNA ligase n=1 Tax=Acuticoccus yangtzensis TaxID=1443441 RepID=UPI0009497CE0|nr:histidine--tRNA ligase [Acuticoccus yangtzensis]